MLDQKIALSALLSLSAVFAVKHVIADFILQTNAIAIGKDRAVDWLKPLLLHAGGHAVLTLAIALVAAPSFAWLAIVDFIVHASIDRSKAIVRARLNVTPADAPFWWLIGIDQALHHLTHLGLIVVLIG